VIMRRRLLIPLVGMVAVAVVAFVVVARDNSPKWPKYESLQKHPDPSVKGNVAYLADKKGTTCAYVVPASGGVPEELLCDGRLHDGAIGFSKEGDVLAMEARTDFVTPGMYWQFAVDPPVMIDSYLIKPGFIDFTGDTDPLLNTSKDDRGVSVSEVDGRQVLHVDAPESYELSFTAYSPDQQWLITRSNRGELLIGDLKGSARKLADAPIARSSKIVGVPAEYAWFLRDAPLNRPVDVQALKKYTAESH
jgi:hypothetical protein